MIDILIPLDNGSRRGDMELKYCLRSIEKYLTGVRNIMIVGQRPHFINWDNVVHVPCEDNPNGWRRAHNIFIKIMAGVNHISDIKFQQTNEDFANNKMTVSAISLSDVFLFMNDDHYLLQEYEAGSFPYYHRGPIDEQDYSKNQPQLTQMQNTVYELNQNPVTGSTFLDYGVHCPILYHKASFRALFSYLPERWPEHGYEIKSFYANSRLIKEDVLCEDLKFKEPLMKSTIYTALEGRHWFSLGDKALFGALPEVLEELYPNKSKYEL